MNDLGFGNSICVRQAFLENYNYSFITFTPFHLNKFDYPNHLGDEEIIKYTKQVIKRQTGLDFKHVVLTNGATGGVVIALRAGKELGYHKCLTRVGPYYLRYPDMIKASGAKHITNIDDLNTNDTAILLDLPSNPLALTNDFTDEKLRFSSIMPYRIIDGVYLNNVYTNGDIKLQEQHMGAFVGSYSKLLGLNGLRIGWIATNGDFLYEKLKTLVTAEYCGLDYAGTELLKGILRDFDWGKFERRAKLKLDYNREEWSKLERFFDGYKVSDIGMFHYTHIDPKLRFLLDKTNVKYTLGSILGTSDDFGRFNLGQDNNLISNIVSNILRKDSIK